MKLRSLSDVHSLLTQSEFKFWWEQFLKAQTALLEAERRTEELWSESQSMEFDADRSHKLATDLLYRANESDDTVASLEFEATQLENRSLKGVGEFEAQRSITSEAWYRLGALEKSRDEVRDRKGAASETRRIEDELQKVSKDYATLDARKVQLWEDVERLWAQFFEVRLLAEEERCIGKKFRHRAEVLLAEGETRRVSARTLREQYETTRSSIEKAKSQVSALLSQARSQFGCATGSHFLYFRHPDDKRISYCVALIDDVETYNLKVKVLDVFEVDQENGVGLLKEAKTGKPSSSVVSSED